MLALKAFVHESVQELDDAKLQLLAETLRIDLRGCDDRRDIERVVTGLICLDQNTSLGVFLSWLRASDDHGVLAKKKPFHNTFVPTIAPQDQQKLQKHTQNQNQNQQGGSPSSSNQTRQPAPEDLVKDHHLDEEIQLRLTELQLLETDFKAAERVAHTGTPTFEKLKEFLVKLTLLRAKEEETRRFFIKQNALLKQQYGEIRDEALHTRAQLDFFVGGFTNLRLRHDALLEKSTQMHAESEMAQEIFLSMSAHESHFAAIMAHTLNDQRAKNQALQVQLDAAEERIRELQEKQQQLVATISQLKQARGDASKDAHCFKQQLRRCKLKMKDMEQASVDCSFFRSQTVNLRQSFANLLGYLRESVLRDTKTPKQALSKEALRIIYQALNGSAATTTPPSQTKPSTANEPPGISSSPGTSSINAIHEDSSAALEPTTEDHVPVAVPKVIKKTAEAKRDLDEAVRGILLMGSAEEESAKCASILSSKLKYAPIDVRKTLLVLESEEREQQVADSLLAGSAEAGANDQPPLPKTPIGIPGGNIGAIAERPLQIASYQKELKKHIEDEMQNRGARGFILFDWEFATQDVNQLIGLGFPVDSIIDLQTPPPSAAPKVLPPAVQTARATTSGQQQPVSSTRSQAAATPTTSPAKASARAPSASLKTPATLSKPPAKATAPASPSRGGARQPTPKTPEAAKKRPVETPLKQSQQPSSSSSPKRPTATPSSSQSRQKFVSSPEKKVQKIDRKAVFKGMLHLYQQVALATFPEERAQLILDVLEQQKEKKATPFIQWDESTSRTNEMLSMFAEDVHMMLYVEQENRKPKKPGDNAPPPTSSSGTTTSNSPSKPGGSSTSRSTSPSKAAPVGKTSRASSKPPVKLTATARGSGAAAAATSRRATSTATSSRSVSPVRPAAGGGGGSGASSPDRSKRAAHLRIVTEELQNGKRDNDKQRERREAPAATERARETEPMERAMEQTQQRRRDTPAPVRLSPPSACGGGGGGGGACDELKEKTGVVHLGDLGEIPMEEDDDEEDSGDGESRRKSWTPTAPTIVQLPSKQSRSRVASVESVDDGTSLRRHSTTTMPPVSGDGQIDTEVFNALPLEIQQEILAERAAEMALAMEIESVVGEREASENSSSREASFERYGGREAHMPQFDEDGCWICRVCTFANHPQLSECEICETLCVQSDEFLFGEERDELRSASRTATPTSSNSRSRAGSMGNDLYSKFSQKLSSSAMSRSLKKIRLPATPAATKLTMKEDPTAEDLLIVATAQIQKLQYSASQTYQSAKQTIIGGKSPSSGRKNADGARLPSQDAIGELGVLQRDLNLKCEAGNELYESLLERLWNAIYQDAPMMLNQSSGGGGDRALALALPKRGFARISDGWIDIGFQGANPDTDFRGGGILALKCLVYAFEAFPRKMLEIVLSQKPSPGKKWYPVCVAGINLTCMIAGFLKLGNGKYAETAEPFWKLFEEPSAFYQLFFYAFVKMDAAWRRMNASYMEFGVVLKATRKMVVYMLDQAPESLNELRDVADKTFLDRFVVCMTSRTLEDSENGECPDPYNVLEDENDALLVSARVALSAKLTVVSPSR